MAQISFLFDFLRCISSSCLKSFGIYSWFSSNINGLIDYTSTLFPSDISYPLLIYESRLALVACYLLFVSTDPDSPFFRCCVSLVNVLHYLIQDITKLYIFIEICQTWKNFYGRWKDVEISLYLLSCTSL